MTSSPSQSISWTETEEHHVTDYLLIMERTPYLTPEKTSKTLSTVGAPRIEGSWRRSILVSRIAFVLAFEEGKRKGPGCCFDSPSYWGRSDTQDTTVIDSLAASQNNDIRTIADKIRHIVSAHTIGVLVTGDDRRGGRHDNDFRDFRRITSPDEVTSKGYPLYQTSDELGDPATIDTRLGTDLLREDMVYDRREELEKLGGSKLEALKF